MARLSTSRKAQVSATYESTLVYYDEPQLIVLSRPNKRKIIATAIIQDGRDYPFFGAEISQEQWERYLREISDLRFLFEYPRFKKWYLFDFSDLDEAGNVKMRSLSREEISEDYLPAGQFFSRSHTEPLGQSHAELGVEKFLIDGAWDFSDFSAFYGKISDLYALFLSIGRFGSDQTERVVRGNIREAYQRYPLKGGASYRFFYRDLFNTQSIMDRLIVDSIQYASPGHVDVHARHDIFGEIRISLDNYRKNATAASKEYHSLRKFLSKSRLLTASAEGFDSKSPYASQINLQTARLCDALSFPYLNQVVDLTGGNDLAAAKIMLSFTRRIDKSFRFFAEGRVVFGGSVDDVRIDLSSYVTLAVSIDEDPLEEDPLE